MATPKELKRVEEEAKKRLEKYEEKFASMIEKLEESEEIIRKHGEQMKKQNDYMLTIIQDMDAIDAKWQTHCTEISKLEERINDLEDDIRMLKG